MNMENIENHYTPNDSIHLDENLDKDLLDLKEFSKIENKLKKSTSSQNSPTQNLFLLPLKKNFSQIPINFPNYLSLEILSILIKKNILDMNLDQQRIDKILENLKNTNPEYASNSPNILMNQILNNYFQELERINDPIDQIIIEIPKNDVELKEIPNKKEIEIQIEEILPNSIQCWICYNYYVKNDQSTIFFQNHDICNSCLINYIEEKIKNNSVLQIKCPDNCGVILTESDIELILKENENLLKKYKYFKNLSLLDLDPDLRWCIKPSCSALIKGCQENGKGICSKCKTEICFKCRGAWHGRKTCEKALDEEFKQYKKTQIIKFCKKCKSRMEKNGGCNHMTCQVCKYQFCWICDRVYEPNHYDKNNIFGCPGMQYSDITGISLKNICLRGYVRLLKVLKILLIILGILLLPIIYILIAIITPGYIYISYRSEHQKKTRKQNLLLAIISIIVGIFLLPLSLILLICPGSCLILKEYRKRKLEGL